MSDSPALPRIAAIILNWNNPADTLACLRSVAALASPGVVPIVVDNGSADDSVARIRAEQPAVEIIETGQNLGYAEGNNVGIRRAMAMGADLVMILNNDVILHPDCMTPLLAELSDASVGVVTPLLADMTHPDRVWALGSAVDPNTGEVARLHANESVSPWCDRASFEVDVASGAAMLVKRDVLESAGLLDGDYFLYYDETDWCMRVRRAGYRIVAVPQAVAWHKVSAALGATSPAIDYYMLRNHLRFIGRNWTGLRRILMMDRVTFRGLRTIAAYTLKSHAGRRTRSRNARLLALRDAALGRWGRMGADVERACRGTAR